jgi:hypothetical protein
MKAALLTILALSAINIAVAQITVTAYSDAGCATVASNPVLGLANPSTASLNVCSKSYTVSGTTFYTKFTVCSATAATTQTYTDAGCTTCQGGTCSPTTVVPGKCVTDVPPGIGSYKIVCSSSASTALAFGVVTAAALAVFL